MREKRNHNGKFIEYIFVKKNRSRKSYRLFYPHDKAKAFS